MNEFEINVFKGSTAKLFWPILRGKSLEWLQTKYPGKKVIFSEQTHSNKVAIVDTNSSQIIDGVDGIVTNGTGTVMGIAVADCQIMFAHDSAKNIIGIAHAGREGTYNNIASDLISKMTTLGANAKNIQIYISPSIDECHYQVDGDNSTNYYKQFLKKYGNKVAKKKPTGKFLNLRQAQIINLMTAGILKENINIDERCSFCAKENFPSHRRESEGRTSNLIGIITIND